VDGCGCDWSGNPCFCGGSPDPNCDPSYCSAGANPIGGASPSYGDRTTQAVGAFVGSHNWLLIGGIVLGGLVVLNAFGHGLAARV